jgi:hypothetical protein
MKLVELLSSFFRNPCFDVLALFVVMSDVERVASVVAVPTAVFVPDEFTR